MVDIENYSLKNISYLHARDPSILSWGRPVLDEVRINLAKKLEEDKSEENIETDLDDKNIQVFLRIKGGIHFENLYKIDGENLKCNIPEGSHALRNVREGDKMLKTYSFTRIFGPNTNQIEIFNSIVKPKILGFINGNSSTVVTYGASGSGKTFTIVGTPEEPGLIPRALEYLFRTIPQLKDKPKVMPMPNGEVRSINEEMCRTEKLQKSSILNATIIDRTKHIKTYTEMQQRLSSEHVADINDISNISVSVWVSFAEIYNENIYDLLKPAAQRGKQRIRLRLGNSEGGCYIKDLTSIHASSGIEAYQILQYGLHNLNYAETCVNSHSSRSHCIFTLKLIQSSEVEESVYVSTFNFCDLAGSERVKKTMNMGDRLKESNNINTSLLVLGRCIKNIRASQQLKDNRLIPFRDSKLTQLFQKALLGFEYIMMVVNINPSRDMFDESQHVLDFSAVAKEITVEEQKPIVRRKKNRFSEYMEKKTGQVQPIEEVEEEDERDIEINKLKVIITDLYTALENKKREFKLEMKLERDHMSSNYNEYIDRLMKEHFETVKKMQKEYDELKVLSDYNLKLLNKKDIITVDSSSEDEASPKKKSSKEVIDSLKNIIRNQSDAIDSLQQELRELKIEKKIFHREIQVSMEEEISVNITLKEAEDAYIELAKELQDEKDKNKALLSKNLELMEKVDYLEELV